MSIAIELAGHILYPRGFLRKYMNKKFSVEICSDTDYEDLVADINYEDEIVAMLSQEMGFENMLIEIYSPKNRASWRFKFSELEDAIQFAKKRLWELRRSIENA